MLALAVQTVVVLEHFNLLEAKGRDFIRRELIIVPRIERGWLRWESGELGLLDKLVLPCVVLILLAYSLPIFALVEWTRARGFLLHTDLQSFRVQCLVSFLLESMWRSCAVVVALDSVSNEAGECLLILLEVLSRLI